MKAGTVTWVSRITLTALNTGLYLILPTLSNRCWLNPFHSSPGYSAKLHFPDFLQLGWAMRFISGYWNMAESDMHYFHLSSKSHAALLCALSLCLLAGQMERIHWGTLSPYSMSKPPEELSRSHPPAPGSRMSLFHFLLCSPPLDCGMSKNYNRFYGILFLEIWGL